MSSRVLLALCACTPLTTESAPRAFLRGDAAADGGNGNPGRRDSALDADARTSEAAPGTDASATPSMDAAAGDASDPSSSEAGTPIEAGSAGDAASSDAGDGATPTPAPDAGPPLAGAPAPMCLDVRERCTSAAQCCNGLSCDVTSIGRTCCGETGASCAFADGRDCCRNLECINGRCGL